MVVFNERLIFWALAFPVLLAGVAVVASKSPMRSAMSLVISFLGLAAIYVVLSAQLMAILQVMVYAGAIMVLFVFIIMLLVPEEKEGKLKAFRLGMFLTILSGAAVLAIGVFLFPDWVRQRAELAGVAPDFGTVENVGRLLYTKYLFPFEFVSLLLLVALVGTVFLAKRKV